MTLALASRMESDVDPRGVWLTDFYAYMLAHNYIFTPTGEHWPASSVNSRIPAQMETDARGNPVLDKDGKPKFISAAAWLDKEKPVEQVTWAPGEAQIIENRLISEGGWILRPGCSCFNQYRPPVVEPGDPTEAQRWIDHVKRVYPSEAAHIINWLAHRVQHPGIKPNHALVLGGSQGVGKDTLLEPVKYAVGPWNVSEVSPQHMLGRFNSFVKSVILRVSEARDLGDIDRFAFYDHMKTYTAAPPDVLRVDEKHIREHSVFNVCGVIITTNHKTDGIYLPPDDRRHFVAWSDAQRDDFTADYWTDLWGWYSTGGLRHVAAYLRTLNIAAFNPKAPPPKTDAFWAIADANRAPEDNDLADALDKIRNPEAVTIERIADAASTMAFSDWLRDRKNNRLVPHRLDDCGYERVRNANAKDGQFMVSGRRQAIYALKSLSVRDRIAAANALASGR